MKSSIGLEVMTVQSFAQLNALKIGPKKKYGIQLMTGSKTYHSLLEFFYIMYLWTELLAPFSFIHRNPSYIPGL